MRWAEFVPRLRECTNRWEAERMHSLLAEFNYDREITIIGNLIVKAYGDCGLLREAWDVFRRIQSRNVYSWNIMIAANAGNGELLRAKEMFEKIPHTDVVSWNIMLSELSRSVELDHIAALFSAMPGKDICTWNALLTANALNGNLSSCLSVLWKMPCVHIVTLNAVLSAHADKKQIFEAREIFDHMPERNDCSWNAMVTAYASNGQFCRAKELMELMSKQSLTSWTAVITGCLLEGKLEEAGSLFERVPEKNVYTWSTMISGYAQNGESREALKVFKLMDLEGVQADPITLISVVYACASIPAVVEGRIIYEMIEENNLMDDVPLGNNLINMFAKCGSLESARRVFDRMYMRDILSWNTMITAYAQVGETSATFELYHTMILLGIQPVGVTFVSILSASSHAGSLKSARQNFFSMSEDFGITPGYEHYRCMVDVLGRVGHLERAESLIETMPYKPEAVIWSSLLGACKNHNDLDRAARIMHRVFKIDPHIRPSSYVLLSSTMRQGNQEERKSEFCVYSS